MAAIAALAAAQRGGAAAAWRAARRSGTALQTLCLPAADAAHAASPWSTGAARGTCTGAAGAMQQQHSWPQREPPRGSSWRPHGDGAPLCLRLYSSSSGSSDREEARPGSSPSSPSSSGATPPRRHGRAPAAVAALQAAGWSRREVLSVPNALSLARLLSGPLIASWIMDAQVWLGLGLGLGQGQGLAPGRAVQAGQAGCTPAGEARRVVGGRASSSGPLHFECCTDRWHALCVARIARQAVWTCAGRPRHPCTLPGPPTSPAGLDRSAARSRPLLCPSGAVGLGAARAGALRRVGLGRRLGGAPLQPALCDRLLPGPAG
mgnify:CR=1 FL=1